MWRVVAVLGAIAWPAAGLAASDVDACQQKKHGEACDSNLAGKDSILLQMEKEKAGRHRAPGGAEAGSNKEEEVPALKPEWAVGFQPLASDIERVERGETALLQEDREGDLRQGARPSNEEWQHFLLVKQLRARGFTCPDGTSFAPNNGEFEWDCRLQRAAEGWSRRMGTEGFEGHRHAGSAPCQRTEAAGFPRMRGCGENLALGRGEPDVAIVQLQESNDHCRNMMDPQYNKIGVGHYYNRNSKYRHYWTDSLGAWHQRPDQSCIGGSPAPSPPPGCADQDTQHCQYYKSKGYCEISDNVKRMCMDTCGIGHCGSSPSPSCTDSDGACEYYRANGYCSSAHIQQSCKKSCGQC